MGAMVLLGAMALGTPAPVATASVAHERIVVTGQRRAMLDTDAIEAVTVLSEETIRGTGARTVAELLESQPGLRVTPDVSGAVQVQLRGFSADQVLILVDGQRPSGHRNGALDLARLGVERVARVEVLKGPATALYGADALGGVLNIITRNPSGPLHARLDAAGGIGTQGTDGGSTIDVSGSVEGGDRESGARLSARYRRRGAYDLSPDSPATTGAASDEAMFDGVYLVRDGETRWRLRAEGSVRQLDAVEAGPVLPRGQRTVHDRHQPGASGGLHGRVSFPALGGSLTFDASGSLTEERIQRTLRGRGPEPEEHTLEIVTQANARWDRAFDAEHFTTLGLDLLRLDLDASRYPELEPRTRGAIYARHEWRPLDALAFVGSVRGELDSQFGPVGSPQVGARYSPVEQLVLRASWGLGYKAPLPRDLGISFSNPSAGYRVEGNPDLEPEQASTFGLGASWSPLDSLRWDVELFHSDVSNLIAALPGSAPAPGEPIVYSYGNVDEARLAGLETQVELRPVSALRFAFAYQGLLAVDTRTDRTLSNRAPHRLVASVRWVLGDFESELRGAWTAARVLYIPEGDGDVRRVAPDYLRLDGKLSYQLTPSLGSFVVLDNLSDAGDPELNPIPPRSLLAGLRYTP